MIGFAHRLLFAFPLNEAEYKSICKIHPYSTRRTENLSLQSQKQPEPTRTHHITQEHNAYLRAAPYRNNLRNNSGASPCSLQLNICNTVE